MTNIKDLLTTIVGIGFLVFTAIQQYLATVVDGGSIDWMKLGLAVVVAIIGYFTGKNANGTLKSPEQVAAQADPGKK
jgi:hypothetical protein